jgi:hypothetical protein
MSRTCPSDGLGAGGVLRRGIDAGDENVGPVLSYERYRIVFVAAGSDDGDPDVLE